MGNDGGSIARRDDLVKVKKRNPHGNVKAQQSQLFRVCALSREPLRAPVVSCPLGRLYNKEAVIAHLLTPSASSATTSDPISHIRSIKDLVTLNLTPNPSYAVTDDRDASVVLGVTEESNAAAPFICPISLREMNGAVKFVYRKPGGSVLSETALKEMRRGAVGDDAEALLVDPVTGTRYEQKEEWVTINPIGEEAEAMKEAWEAVKVREKEEKKAAKERKRKDHPKATSEEQDGGARTTAKKVKATLPPPPQPAVNAGASVPHLSATIAAKLKEQAAVSPAIASLYAAKDDGTNKDKDGRSNWMTRGAFTRYA